MKAAVHRSYGPPEVLKIEDVRQPSIQEDEDGRVLIKVHSASINPFDIWHRMGYLPVRTSNGFRIPKQQILGIDVAGTVEAVSRNVSRFKVGHPVFGSCLGSHAEFVRARENAICMIPKNLTFQRSGSYTVRCSDSPARIKRRRSNQERSKGPGLWRLGRHWTFCCSACQILRDGSNCCLQHIQSPLGERPRSA